MSHSIFNSIIVHYPLEYFIQWVWPEDIVLNIHDRPLVVQLVHCVECHVCDSLHTLPRDQ